MMGYCNIIFIRNNGQRVKIIINKTSASEVPGTFENFLNKERGQHAYYIWTDRVTKVGTFCIVKQLRSEVNVQT